MNYYNHKILNLIVDNILNLSLDELKDVYSLFDEGGVKEIDALKSKNIYLDLRHNARTSPYNSFVSLDDFYVNLLMILSISI
jgi:hypothetical protein